MIACLALPTHSAVPPPAPPWQVWLASSLLADSLAVAAQTLLARSLAAGQGGSGRAVVQRTVQLALGLGLLLAGGLALGRGGIAAAFSRDPAVLGTLSLVMPAVVSLALGSSGLAGFTRCMLIARTAGGAGVLQQAITTYAHTPLYNVMNPKLQILTQPLNSLAFLMDGVLYGAGGYRYAALAMVAACLPAAAAMLGAAQLAGTPGVALPPADVQLLGVWAGLGLLMLGRFATIYLPLQQRKHPFEQL